MIKRPHKRKRSPGPSNTVVPDEADIVINNTSVGLYPEVDARLDVDVDSLKPQMVVADGIPNPPRTRWIRDAKRAVAVSWTDSRCSSPKELSESNIGRASTQTPPSCGRHSKKHFHFDFFVPASRQL